MWSDVVGENDGDVGIHFEELLQGAFGFTEDVLFVDSLVQQMGLFGHKNVDMIGQHGAHDDAVNGRCDPVDTAVNGCEGQIQGLVLEYVGCKLCTYPTVLKDVVEGVGAVVMLPISG